MFGTLGGPTGTAWSPSTTSLINAIGNLSTTIPVKSPFAFLRLLTNIGKRYKRVSGDCSDLACVYGRGETLPQIPRAGGPLVTGFEPIQPVPLIRFPRFHTTDPRTAHRNHILTLYVDPMVG